MNFGIRCCSYKNLEELFSKDILIKALSLCLFYVNYYQKAWITCMKIHPTKTRKIVDMNNKQPKWFHLSNILSNNVVKFVITSVLVVMFMGMSFSKTESLPANFVDIQVRSGDTVWTIASQYTSDKEDIRVLVHAITKINGLNRNAFIYSGQTLKVPTPILVSMEVSNTNAK